MSAFKKRVEAGNEIIAERDPIDWPEIPRQYEEFCPFEAQFLLEVSPTRTTRSAVKRAKEEAKRARKRHLRAVKRRVN